VGGSVAERTKLEVCVGPINTDCPSCSLRTAKTSCDLLLSEALVRLLKGQSRFLPRSSRTWLAAVQAYFIYSFVITTFIYPIVVHWGWGYGWLSAFGAYPDENNQPRPIFSQSTDSNGMIDFAGSGPGLPASLRRAISGERHEPP